MTTIIFGSPTLPTAGLTPYRSLVRTVQPVVEPVSLADAKVQCRVDTDAENAYIASLITIARQYVEDALDITICNSTWEARYDLFPVWEIKLPRPPLRDATITVTYRNGDGTNGTITSTAGQFRYDHLSVPGRIYPNWATAWPPVRGDENSVVVQFQAGYGADGTNVPAAIKHLILMLVAHWFEARQPAVQGSVMPVPHTFETLLVHAGVGIYR